MDAPMPPSNPEHTSNPSAGPHNASTCLVNLTDLKATIRAKKFMPYEHRMPPDTLQLLTLSILHAKHGKIGDVTAVLVKSRCSNIFLEVMDIDTELFTIGSALFDKYGEIRPWLVREGGERDGTPVGNEYHKGSGVWGRELDLGRLVFVFCVSVEPQYRKQGIASWALQQLYASEHIHKDDKFLCWPR
ncbi:hypothetical protein C8R46DRAFT_507637 [Mycena filopes]|nr:hypothetical protein C8R46DRAFT_507637 [Mycena filopes]